MKSLINIAIAFFGFSSALILQAEESFIPDPPSLNSSNYILIDFATNRILAEKGSEERMEPASLTKIMTGYVVADQVSEGFINIDDDLNSPILAAWIQITFPCGLFIFEIP